jgi:putative nucleotidyltransferase with HDIG domain
MALARDVRSIADRDRLLVHATPAQHVLRQLQLSRSGVDVDLTAAVMTDPALTAAVVRAANSAHLGFSRRISGVRQAAVLLGGKVTESIAAGRVADLVFDHAPPDYPDWLWPHSLAVACAARVLAKRTGEHVDDAFTAGMLHDIGWLLAASRGVHLDNGDVDHAHQGGELLSRWNFPEHLVTAVQQHHARPAALVGRLERIVVAAHGIAAGMGVSSPETSISKLDSLRLLDITDVRASVVIAEVEQDLVALTSDLRSAS